MSMREKNCRRMTARMCKWNDIFISFYVLVLSSVVANGINSFSYSKLNSPSFGVVVVGEYDSTSALACCSKCSTKHASPFLVYNNDLSSCACALTLSTNVPPPSGSDQLYVHPMTSSCDVINGFNIYVYDDVAVCLKIVLNEKNYTDAEVACSEYTNGHLFLMDTRDKFEILKSACEIQNTVLSVFWIGMDDREEEDVFVWADGRVVTQGERNSLFNSRNPDNNGGNENCVEFRENTFALNDGKCAALRKYVCEITTS